MSKIGLIIGREYITRVRKKSFIVMTILGPILMGGFLAGALWLGMQDASENQVLVSDPGGLFNTRLKDGNGVKFIHKKEEIPVLDFRDKEEYEKYNMLINVPADPLRNNSMKGVYRTKVSSRVENYITSQINSVIEQLKVEDAKIDPSVYEYIKGTKINVVYSDVSDLGKNKSDYVPILGFVFTIMIYLFIFLYGSQVMRGVIEEKTNRVVEVIVSSVSPFQLMMGKIIGIAMVGLTQFLIWIATMFLIFWGLKSFVFTDVYDPSQVANMQVEGLVASSPMGMATNMSGNSELFNLIYYEINYPFVISVFIFYFLVGYLVYASLFAAVGAMVDSETDSQQFMLPISIPLIFAYIISMMGLENPEGSAQVWSSIVPFTSPISMMMRAVTESVPVWQLVTSMVLLVLTFFFTVWLGAKLYRTGILMYGKKPTYRELWKWLRYKS